MSQQRHVIKQLILELQLDSQQNAFELQNEVSQLCRTKIVPLIDELLSQLSNPDVIDRIETLELDLGDIDIENLERSLIEKTTQHLNQQLKKLIPDVPDSQPPVNDSFDPRSTKRSNSINNQAKTTPAKTNLELLTYFIQTGTLPWWAEQLSKQELEERFQSLLIRAPEALKHLLFTPDERPLKRIIYQFSDLILLQLGQMLVPSLSPSFVKGYQSMTNMQQEETTTNLPRQQHRLEYWRGLLYSLLARQDIPLDEHQILKEVQLHLARYEAQRQQVSGLENELSDNPLVQQELELSASNNPFRGSGDRFYHADEIYVANAGLVILWPFLERFYKALGLVQTQSFKNLESAERAVLILQYLVDGSIDISEPNLPLNKVLCGFNPFEPVPTAFEPTEPEQTECETLLSAVIQHWSSLKNTSIAGLRQLFLQRAGILRVRDGCWLLQVEQAAQDVLLDSIPWSIRVVKLPWMEGIVYVEW